MDEFGETWGTFARPADHEDDEWDLPDPRVKDGDHE